VSSGTWDATDLVDALVAAARAVEEQAEGLDRLDEVDDGDCGRNLARTVAAVAEAASGADAAFAPVLSAVAGVEGVGTSGRVLLALLAGWSDAMAAHDRVDGMRFALALEAGADRARLLTGISPEGPMCEVALAAATAALDRADRDGTLAEVAHEAAEAAMDALEATEAGTGTRADAGMVDAGAAGWTIVLDALAAAGGAWDGGAGEDHSAGGEGSGLERGSGRYVVTLTLRSLDESQVGRLGAVWRTLGEAVQVVQTNVDTWGATVATDDIGAVIEAALAFGRPSRIRVEDRHEAVHEA
jgi:dihydroxyacetone kinase-like predicted kinase